MDAGSTAAWSTPRPSRPARPAARCSTKTGGWSGLNTNRIGEGFYLALPADGGLRARVDALARGETPAPSAARRGRGAVAHRTADAPVGRAARARRRARPRRRGRQPGRRCRDRGRRLARGRRRGARSRRRRPVRRARGARAPVRPQAGPWRRRADGQGRTGSGDACPPKARGRPAYRPAARSTGRRGRPWVSRSRHAASRAASASIGQGQDRGGQQPRVLALPMATVATGIPLRHLDDRQQRIEPAEMLGRDRHADDRQRRLGGEHPGQVGRAAGAGDDHPDARGRLRPRRRRTGDPGSGAPRRP